MEWKSKQLLLENTEILSSIGKEGIEYLAQLSVERDYDTGSYVFWEDDPPGYLYILVSGRIKILKHSEQGRDVIITFFGRGEMFGEVAILENKPYPASAIATEPSKVLAISRKDFLSFVSKYPGASIGIIGILSSRLREAQNRLRSMASQRVEQRLAGTLLTLSNKIGGTLPFTRQQLAEMSGTTTETAIRFFVRLKDGGIIKSGRGQIIILDKRKLKLLSEGPPKL
jgi:CRP/FNR family transcriptional regulator